MQTLTKLFSITILSSIFCSGLFAIEKKPPLDPSKLTGKEIIATVGDIKIFALNVLKLEANHLKRSTPKDMPTVRLSEMERMKLRKQIVEKEIEGRLILEYVEEKKLKAPQTSIEAKVQQLKQQLAQNGTTYEEFLKSMLKTDAEFREISHAAMAIELLCLKEIPETEVKRTFDNGKKFIPFRGCAEIFFSHNEAPESMSKRSKMEAKVLATKVRDRIRKGASFDELATIEGDSPYKKRAGFIGFLPEFTAPHAQPLPKPFLAALYKLEKVGDITEVVETQIGFHIIKLTNIKTYDDFKAPIRQKLANERVRSLTRQLLETRAEKIVYDMDYLRMDSLPLK